MRCLGRFSAPGGQARGGALFNRYTVVLPALGPEETLTCAKPSRGGAACPQPTQACCSGDFPVIGCVEEEEEEDAFRKAG